MRAQFVRGQDPKDAMKIGNLYSRIDNQIEDIWANQSTQNEWAIPCHRHSYLGGG